MEDETKETFASIISKVERDIKPLGFEIWSTDRCYITGSFSWEDHMIPTENSRHELTLNIVYMKDTSQVKDTFSTTIISKIEEPMVALGFDLSDIKREFKPACKLSGGNQTEGKTLFIISFVRVGELD
jgi:hypothetical protein